MTDSLPPDDLGGRAVRGASVTLMGQAVRIVVLLVSTIALSRLVSPSDFGLMAIAASMVAFGELVRDFGLSTAAARAPSLSQGQKSNLFWINTGLGALLSLAAWFSAPLIAGFFGQDALGPIVQAISVVFVLSGISTQFRAELNRELRFGALTTTDTLPVALGLVGALLFATVDRSYWVLVVQQLVTAGSGLVISIALARWLPGIPSRRSSIRELLNFGLGLFGTQGVAYVTKNIDNISLGYFWGPAPLGIYSRAYQLLMMPINQISAPLTRVAVPILTRVAPDRKRFSRYLQAGQLVGGVGLGIFYGIAIGLADPLVFLVFGDQWGAMVPIFQALAVGGIFRALNQVSFWAFLATGRTTAQFRFYLVSQPLIVVMILAGLPWGALGVAVGHSIGYAVNWVISLLWCGRVTETDMAPLLRTGLLNILVFVVPAVGSGLVATALVADPLLAVLLGIAMFAAYILLGYMLSGYMRSVVQTVLNGVKKLRKRGS